MVAAQRGDALAMDALLRSLTPLVSRLCGAIALDDGDDAMQETVIAVLRALPGLREPAAVHGWARRIASREAVRVAKRRLPAVDDAVLSDVPARLPDPDAVVDVRTTLAGLRPEHRAILVLRDVEGLSESEAAALLDVAEGTVKSRLHRARAAFRAGWSR